jgi:hypothetical protein
VKEGVNAMLNPPDPNRPAFFPSAIAGAGSPVTCTACGCRLQAVGVDGETQWFHFGPLAGRDARGCRVACVDDAHDEVGRPVAAVLA